MSRQTHTRGLRRFLAAAGRYRKDKKIALFLSAVLGI
jgi:hypothetical protein